MLIDWITARLDRELFTPEQWQKLDNMADRVLRLCPRTGDVRWQISAWESVRSDSHQIAVKVGGDALWMQGSPARVMGDGCTVFGSGASHALDLVGCVQRMAQFVGGMIGFDLPGKPIQWVISRVDVTANLLLDDLSSVRTALRVLRDCEGGRYRVSQQAGDTVYWSHKSRLKSGKAYAKGPHLEYLQRQQTYTGRPYNSHDIQQANRLLRLELKLGREFWRRIDCHWSAITPSQLQKEWSNYFDRMIGHADMKTETDIKTRIFQAAPTEGQGRAAYGTWLLIRSEGWETAKESTCRTTWYRNLKILRAAGLGDADIASGRVVEIRRRIIETQLIDSWEALKAA